jgi:hypothetical protein
MGLLSKAASGSPANAELSNGGLLKIISRKRKKLEKNSFLPQDENKSSCPLSPLEKSVMEKLNLCCAKFGVFQGIIIESLTNSTEEFTSRLTFMVSDFGTAQSLAQGRALVIFSSGQDGELIGNHLEKSVPGKKIFCFNANTPQEVFPLIKSYL